MEELGSLIHVAIHRTTADLLFAHPAQQAGDLTADYVLGVRVSFFDS